jgi:PAS domain S-box-containing protein
MTDEIVMSHKSKRRWAIISYTTALALITSATTVGYFREVTKREKAEADRIELALKHAEADHLLAEAQVKLDVLNAREEGTAFLRESANFGYAILDENGNVVLWNGALARWTGYTDSEMIGNDVLKLMPEDKRALHQDSYKKIISDPKSLKTVYKIHCTLIPKDPTEKPFEVIINVRVVKVKSTNEIQAIALIDLPYRIKEMGKVNVEEIKQ